MTAIRRSGADIPAVQPTMGMDQMRPTSRVVVFAAVLKYPGSLSCDEGGRRQARSTDSYVVAAALDGAVERVGYT